MEVQSLLDKTISNLKGVIDTNNVVGAPIIAGDNTVIIPVSKLTFAFLTGGGEYSESSPKVKESELPYATGSGGGVNVTPIGFLVSSNQKTNFVKVDNTAIGDNKWMDLISACVNLVNDNSKN